MMDLNKKQKNALKRIAHNLSPEFRIGKNGVTDNVKKAIADYIKVHEIVKIKLLEIPENETTKSIANSITEMLKGNLISIVGGSFVIFKRNAQKPVINFKEFQE